MQMFKAIWKAEQNHFNRMVFSLTLILLSGLVGCDSRDD